MPTDSIFYNYVFKDKKSIENFFNAVEVLLKMRDEQKNDSENEIIDCSLVTDEEAEDFIKKYSKSHI